MFNLNKKNKNKDQTKKEYIKYEDGEIISVAMEDQTFYFSEDDVPINEDIFKTEELNKMIENKSDTIVEPQTKPVRKTKKELFVLKVKSLITRKWFKGLIGILIILFFVFSFYNVYRQFNDLSVQETDNSEIDENGEKNEASNNSVNNVTVTPATTQGNNSEDNTVDVGENKPVDNQDEKVDEGNTSDDNVSNPTPTTTPDIIKDKPTLSTLESIFSTVNNVNVSAINETNIEVSKITEYIDNKTNKIALKDLMLGKYESKKSLNLYLLTAKPMFEEEGLTGFYDATEKRLLNFINFSKDVIDLLDINAEKSVVQTKLDEFLVNESSLLQAQNVELIKVLDTQGIEYTVNELTNQITFTIN